MRTSWAAWIPVVALVVGEAALVDVEAVAPNADVLGAVVVVVAVVVGHAAGRDGGVVALELL